MAKKPVEKDYQVGDRVTILAIEPNCFGTNERMREAIGTNKKIQAGLRHGYVGREFYVTLDDGFSYPISGLKRTHKAKITPAVQDLKDVIDKVSVVAKPKEVGIIVSKPAAEKPIETKPSPFQVGMKHLKALEDAIGIGDAGTCSYSKKLIGDEVEYRHQVRDACHARLGHYHLGKVAESLVLNIHKHFPQFNDDKERIKQYKVYVEYILAASPWKKCFKYYGIKHALKHGVMMNIEMTRGQLAGGAVALRQGSEYQGTTLPLFSEVLDLGFTGNTAWVVASSVTITGRKYIWNPISNGHRCMYGKQDKEEFLRFFREGYFLDLKQKSYRLDNNHYDGIAKHAASIPKENYEYYRDYKPPEKSIDLFLRDVIFKASRAAATFGNPANVITKEDFLAALPILDNLLNN